MLAPIPADKSQLSAAMQSFGKLQIFSILGVAKTVNRVMKIVLKDLTPWPGSLGHASFGHLKGMFIFLLESIQKILTPSPERQTTALKIMSV